MPSSSRANANDNSDLNLLDRTAHVFWSMFGIINLFAKSLFAPPRQTGRSNQGEGNVHKLNLPMGGGRG